MGQIIYADEAFTLFERIIEMTPGVVGAPTRALPLPRTTAPPVRWYRSRGAASPHIGSPRLTRAFWSWQRHVTWPFGGRAAPASVITARAGRSWDPSATSLIRSIHLQREMS